MSTPVRYIPIISPRIPNQYTTPSTESLNRSITNTVLAIRAKTGFLNIEIPLEYIAIALYITLIIILAIASILLVIVPRSTHFLEENIAFRRQKPSKQQSLFYTYESIKAKLRELFIKLCNVYYCNNCTPRELAKKSNKKELEFFATVYEEIVYGSKYRDDVHEIIRKVEREWENH